MQDGTKVKAQAAQSSFRRKRLCGAFSGGAPAGEAMGDPRGQDSARQVAAREPVAQEREQRLKAALEQLAAIRRTRKTARRRRRPG